MKFYTVGLTASCVVPALAIAIADNGSSPPGPDGGVGATVQTSSGPITGHAAKNGISEYLGIPYAQPPLGPLRFAAPQQFTSTAPVNAAVFVSARALMLVPVPWGKAKDRPYSKLTVGVLNSRRMPNSHPKNWGQ